LEEGKRGRLTSIAHAAGRIRALVERAVEAVKKAVQAVSPCCGIMII
jgi:hypothetical protein